MAAFLSEAAASEDFVIYRNLPTKPSLAVQSFVAKLLICCQASAFWPTGALGPG